MSLTVIVLTFNEQRHIERCLSSLWKVATRVVVIDSFSTDNTVELARSLGADVLQHRFVNQAQQYQWAIENASISTNWTLRIDADEYLEPALQESIRSFLSDPGTFNAVYLRRKICFLGRPIRHGFFYPLLILRMYRSEQGRMEQRWMDEHIVVENPVTTTLDGDLTDDNLNDLAWWTAKHVGYARREAWQVIAGRERGTATIESQLSGAARYKRWLKERLYNRLPSGLRSSLYFFYRYFIGRGFLDGKEGFYFHFLQAFWYRAYVDATLFELEREALADGCTPFELLRKRGILSG